MAWSDVCFIRIEYGGEAELYDILESTFPIFNKKLMVRALIIRDTRAHTHMLTDMASIQGIVFAY
jgi:hypothetical protein